ncbi:MULTISPECIES: hypothetical protein [unclassified Tolypothrix]|uniref:hypothetical protein n=1 Tax=unclassified Tolypothrix TaxID=2649714 RepID=UPI0005EAA6DD|nr:MULTISPECIES: hypothetical protein [unclassified Tolypothrix]BAY89453.1 hypothetical protein NIES3275_14560 [Microchaete diplosiphon NIES-3275]EKF01816.1 hypothetical protein FDUTEX481_07421 [Tolypothrix sp. PCC 7601]MBE9083728.1 hypothetical protein [Tolypothrix sp. LEGE 11397]UYD23739.1 hypothetical protein HGR01_19705 [Tolypothrix sp. PCC 7712]UYD34037.1 hypothetical protein HG267_35060 [Tolypothrix sp. PCC 7601]
MISPYLKEIERDLSNLSLEELEWLLERIESKVQEKKQLSHQLANVQSMNQQLAAMANDLDIQREIASVASCKNKSSNFFNCY